MKRWILLRIPPQGENTWVTFNPDQFKRGLDVLYPQINEQCACVERARVDILPYHPYIWVDEDGFAHELPPNLQATRLAGQRIFGVALLDLGKWDLDKPEELHRWEKRIASYPRNIGSFPFIPKKIEFPEGP